jgi:hypothetical protein
VSKAASGLFYLRNDTAGGSISFFIEADAARTTPLVMGINNYSQYSALNALYDITVNGKRIPIAATVKAPSEERGGALTESTIGDIPLARRAKRIGLHLHPRPLFFGLHRFEFRSRLLSKQRFSAP